MKKNAILAWLVVLVFLSASLACSLPVDLPFLTGESQDTPQPLSTGVAQATKAPNATQPKPSETPKPTVKAANPVPLPLRQGLASLDTYRLTIRAGSSGSDTLEKSDLVVLVEYNGKTKSNHWKMTTTNVTEDEPKPEVSTSEYYKVGSKSCSLSSSSSSTKTPTAKIEDSDLVVQDLANSLSYLVDYNLYAENPVFVAEETLNGVVTNHFKFKVTQLGKDSGAVVKQNSGEYWVAKDGQYLVKYTVILEMDSDKTGTKSVRTELNLELTAINKTVEIAFPPNCTLK